MRYSDEEGIALTRILNWIDSNNIFAQTKIELKLGSGVFVLKFKLTDKSDFDVKLDSEYLVFEVSCDGVPWVFGGKIGEIDELIKRLTEWREKCVQKGYLR